MAQPTISYLGDNDNIDPKMVFGETPGSSSANNSLPANEQVTMAGSSPALLKAAASQEQIMKRDEILKPIFGDVGDLYNVESTVLLHGRMFLTSKFLCFYSNLFGLEKKIRIPWSHITSINKENTALVIPNAISVTTMRKEYIFRSFWDRDDCYEVLIRVLSICGKRSSHTRPASTIILPSKRMDTIEEGPSGINVRLSDSGVFSANSSAANALSAAVSTSTSSSNSTSIGVTSVSTVPLPATGTDNVFSTPVRDRDAGQESTAWLSSTSTKQYDLLNSGTATRRFSAPKSMETAADPRSSSARPPSTRPSSMSIFRTNKSDAVQPTDTLPAAPTNSNSGTNSLTTATTTAGVLSTNQPEESTSGKSTVSSLAGNVKPSTAADDEEETETTSSPQAIQASNSGNIDLVNINEATPDQIATWTAALEAEIKRSKLCTVVVTSELNVPLSEFCQLFINDGASHGIDKYHESKTDHHLELSPWVNNPSIGAHCRELKYIKPLKHVPGISQSRGCRSQRLSRFGSVGIVLYSSTAMEDVPAASCFVVDELLSVVALNPNPADKSAPTKVKVEISYEVKFLKSTMLKYMIQNGSDKDMLIWIKDYFSFFEEAIRTSHAAKEPEVEPGVTLSAGDGSPKVVFGKIISVTPATPSVQESVSSSTAKMSPDGGMTIGLGSLNISVGFVTQIASFIIILLLSVQWQRMNARIVPINKKIDHLTQTIDSLLQRQQAFDARWEHLLGPSTGHGSHQPSEHRALFDAMLRKSEDDQVWHNPVTSKAEISRHLRLLAKQLEELTEDVDHLKL